MRLNIVAIPVKHHNPPGNYFDFHYGFEGNRYYLWQNYTHFHLGYLNDTIKKISASVSRRFGKEVEVVKSELQIPDAERQDYYLMQSELEKLAKKLHQQIDASDLLVLLGGDHIGGYILYHSPGRVLRFDAHEDRVNYDNSCPRVSCANYVSAALDSRIKKEDEIIEHNTEQQMGTINPLPKIIDVDFDAFPEDLHIVSTQRGYCYGNASPTHLYNALRTFQPKTIGFFEYYPEDDVNENGLRIIDESIGILINQRLTK